MIGVARKRVISNICVFTFARINDGLITRCDITGNENSINNGCWKGIGRARKDDSALPCHRAAVSRFLFFFFFNNPTIWLSVIIIDSLNFLAPDK